jgi:hypothetical protein
MPVSFLEQKDACAQYLKNDNSLFRIARIPSMAANYDMDEGAGLQFATGYDPFNLKHYGMYFDIANYGKAHPGFNHVKAELNRLSRADLLDALNVKYLVSAAPLAGLNDNYKLIRQFRKQYFYKLYEGFQCSDTYLYENLNAKPRAYWASRVISADDEAQAASLLENNGISDTAIVINPKLSLGARTEAKEAEIFSTQKAQRMVIPFARFLRKKTSSIFRRIPRPNENFGFKGKPMNEASKVSVNATVKVESFSAGHLALETVNSEPGFLVVSEIWHPGWKAEIDGAPAKIYQTDLALMGLYAPQGRHKVRLNFLPYGLVAGALISLLSLAALFIIVLRRENVEALIERLERLRKLDKAF